MILGVAAKPSKGSSLDRLVQVTFVNVINNF